MRTRNVIKTIMLASAFCLLHQATAPAQVYVVPRTTYYAPATVVAPSPIIYETRRPVTTYYAPSVPYVAPYVSPAPVYVTPAPSPVVTYYAPSVVAPVYAPTVVYRPAYVPGEPVRNTFRAIFR